MPPIVLILCGLVYAVFFLAMAIRRPAVALTLIFASSPMNQDVSGGGPLKFSLAEVNLLLSVPVVLFRMRRPAGLTVLVASLLYLLIGFGCSTLNWRSTTPVVFVQCSLYLVIAVWVFSSLARRVEDFRPCFNGYILFALVLASIITITRSPFVLGIHKNNAGSAVAVGFLIAFELYFQAKAKSAKVLYLFALSVLGSGLLFTLSRGAWLSAIVGSGVIFILRGQFALMLRASFVLIIAAVVGWNLLPQKSREYASGLSADDWNIKMRYKMKDFALDHFKSSPVTGVGLGLRKEYDSTNLVFSTLAETGVLGLTSLSLVYVAVGSLLWRARRGLAKDSFALSVVAIAGAISMAKLAHGMVDHYWVRGTLMAAWASVGMAAWVARERKIARARVGSRRRKAPSLTDPEDLGLTASGPSVKSDRLMGASWPTIPLVLSVTLLTVLPLWE